MANSMSGQQAVVMDARGRISFPMQFRSVIGEALFVSPDTGYRGYLVVRSEEGYNTYRQQLYDEGTARGDDPEDVIDDVRDFAMATANLSPDKNGRITLTDKLIEHAGLTGRVVVIGVGDYAEIWDADKLAAYEQRRAEEKAKRRAKKDAERRERLAKEGL